MVNGCSVVVVMPAYNAARTVARTVAEVLAFPADGNRYEVVHGELLVTPAPRALHQCVAGQLYRRLGDYLDGLGRLATVWYSPLVTRWEEERQPVRRLADGSCLAEQPYVEEGWLTQHLLPFTDQARLLAPPQAVDHLRGAVRRLLALYG